MFFCVSVIFACKIFLLSLKNKFQGKRMPFDIKNIHANIFFSSCKRKNCPNMRTIYIFYVHLFQITPTKHSKNDIANAMPIQNLIFI